MIPVRGVQRALRSLAPEYLRVHNVGTVREVLDEGAQEGGLPPGLEGYEYPLKVIEALGGEVDVSRAVPSQLGSHVRTHARRVVTSLRQNPRRRIEECEVDESSVDEVPELTEVVPSNPVVITLHAFRPFEQRRYPPHLPALGGRAYRLGEGAKVRGGIHAPASVVIRPLPKVVVDLAQIARSPRVQRAPSPVAASLDVGPPERILVREYGHLLPGADVPVSRVGFSRGSRTA
mmetsp:Transcript_32491/g.78667  ORF Transcript_32491/g.78667 Transcript_32491/m.78667 type:complete len:233 (+) Transcript_32491:20-718(+)